MTRTRDLWAACTTLFLMLVAIQVMLLPKGFHARPPQRPNGMTDGMIAYRMAWNLTHHGTIAFSEEEAQRIGPRVVQNDNGQHYAVFGIGYPAALAVPILAERLLGISDPHKPGPLTRLVNPIAMAATAILIMLILTGMGCPPQSAAWGALFYALTTMALPYARLSYDMTLGVFAVVASLWFAFSWSRNPQPHFLFWLGVCLGLSAVVRLPSLIFAPLLVVYLLRAECSPHRMLPLLAGLAPFLLCIACYNWARFGGPLVTGYHQGLPAAHFNANLGVSLPALVASPGRSIFLFSPLLILAFFSPGLLKKGETQLILTMGGLNILFYALVENWYSTFAWGPRYQLLLVPLLSIPLGLWLRDRTKPTVLALFIAGALYQLLLCLVPFGPMSPQKLWSWRASQITRNAIDAFHVLIRGDWASLDVWWTGRWIPAFLGLVFVCLCALRLKQQLQTLEEHPC